MKTKGVEMAGLGIRTNQWTTAQAKIDDGKRHLLICAKVTGTRVVGR